MPKSFVKLTAISNPPVAGQTPEITLQLPENRRIHVVEFEGKSGAAQQMAAGFSDILLRLGGNDQRTHDVTQLSTLNGAYGAAFSVDNDVNGGKFNLPMFFSQPWRKQYAAEERFALDIQTGVNAQIVVKQLAAATAPTAEFWAVVEDLDTIPADRDAQGNFLFRNLDKQGRPVFLRCFRRSIPFAVNVEDHVGHDAPERYERLVFFDPSGGGTIDALRITKNGKEVYNLTKARNDVLMKRYGLTAVAGRLDVVADITDNPLDAWIWSRTDQVKFEFTFGAGAAGNVVILTERTGSPV